MKNNNPASADINKALKQLKKALDNSVKEIERSFEKRLKNILKHK